MHKALPFGERNPLVGLWHIASFVSLRVLNAIEAIADNAGLAVGLDPIAIDP